MKTIIGCCNLVLILTSLVFAQRAHGPSCANDTIRTDSNFIVVRQDGSACNHVIWTDELYSVGVKSAIATLSNSIMSDSYSVRSFAAWMPVPQRTNKYLIVEKTLFYKTIFDSGLNASGIVVTKVGIDIFIWNSDQTDSMREFAYHEFVSSDVNVDAIPALPGEMLDGSLVRIECVSDMGKVAYLRIISAAEIDQATTAVINKPMVASMARVISVRIFDLMGRKIINPKQAGIQIRLLPNGEVIRSCSFIGNIARLR